MPHSEFLTALPAVRQVLSSFCCLHNGNKMRNLQNFHPDIVIVY